MFLSDSSGIFLTILGAVSGFASGLLGVGGGIVIVPALIFALPQFGVSGAEIPKIAMATSLALIVPTSIASAQAHAARSAVDWPMLGRFVPSIMAGAFLSTMIVPKLNSDVVVLLFVAFAVVSSWQMLRAGNRETFNAGEMKPSHSATTALQGAAVGGMAAILGIGGAALIMPILLRSILMQRAIGTAAALAVPMSLAGSVGYGLAAAPSGCGQGCMGYIFFPAVAAIGIGAVLLAPLGAWLAHHAPVAILRRLFALFLICAAGNLAFKTLYPEVVTAEAPRMTGIIQGLIPKRAPSALPHREEVIVHRRHPTRQHFETGEPPEPPEPGFGFSSPPSERSPSIDLMTDYHRSHDADRLST